MRCAREANAEEVVVTSRVENMLRSELGNSQRVTKSKFASVNLRRVNISPMFELSSQYNVLKHATKEDEFDSLEGELMYFVPPPILQILSHEGRDQERWANDRRMETTVVRFRVRMGENTKNRSSDLSLDDLQSTISVIQDNVHHYGGDVLSIHLKGCDLYALSCFGMPTELHEDDPERAVLSAMKIRTQLPKFPTLAIATSGAVFCGSVGLDNSKRYTVLGVPVEQSASMMLSCKLTSGVCCDEMT